MQGYWSHLTKLGTARIALRANGWYVSLGDEDLDGPFETAQHALDNFLLDVTPAHSSGTAASSLGLPEDIDGWSFTPLR